MVEFAPGIALANIHADMVSADKKREEADRAKEELIKKSQELFEQADQILRAKGKAHQKDVGRVAERGGTIGYSSKENYLETPPATVEFEGKKAKIVLAEDFASSPGYRVAKDKIALRGKFYKGSDEKQIFQIDRNGNTKNWLGESATLEQIDMVRAVLSLVYKSLPESKRSKDLRKFTKG